MKKILIGLLIVIVLVVGICGFLFGSDLLNGGIKEGTVAFSVPSGAGTLLIASDLEKEGAIDHPKAFSLYAFAKGYDEKWVSGTFTLEKGMGYKELCVLLTTPVPSGKKVVIPEGKQVRQMAKILENAGICPAADFLAAAGENTYDYPFLKGIDHENPLEGYLYPDTYYFEEGTEPDVIINEMLDNFGKKVYQQKYIDRAEELGYTFDEMIILASIVESEATTKEDRENVAGVFFNRLNNPAYTKLQSCVTVEYAMGVKKSIISKADTEFDSPYNTYMYPGLPVGPICCPGTESLEATLWYADNSYYYFQSDETGKLHFAETFEEHAAIQKDVQANWKGEVIEDYNDTVKNGEQ